MKTDRDTAIRAVRRLVMDIAPGANVDFFAHPGDDENIEALRISHHDAHIQRVVSEIAAGILTQVGYPIRRSAAPTSELVSLLEHEPRQCLSESAEALAEERFHDAFRRARGAVDPDIDLES